jgi:hypothetical protein
VPQREYHSVVQSHGITGNYYKKTPQYAREKAKKHILFPFSTSIPSASIENNFYP